MSTKKQQMQSMIHYFREKSGQQSISMRDVAKFAVGLGWRLPTPKKAIDLLAEQFSSAAREETRKDAVTGRPYRVNLAVTTWQGAEQLTLWTDTDEAPRRIAHKSYFQRREQMIGDAVQLSFDVEHWNRVNPNDQPIIVPMDFAPDVEWRKNAPDEDAQTA